MTASGAVVPYFRGVMNALKHKEWKDALNDENIPSTIIDRSYHLRLEEGSVIKQNQMLIELNQPIQVRLFVKGFRDTAERRDKAAEYMQEMIQKSLHEERRVANAYGIKNVTLISHRIDELDQSNDNTMRVTVRFNCYLIMASLA